MKVVLLSDPNSPHTYKWTKSLKERGVDVHLVGLNGSDSNRYDLLGVKVYCYNLSWLTKEDEGRFAKLLYIKAIPFIRKVIKEIKPDIVHSHYASSYGLLGALSGFHPFVISVWGSDVFDFPNNSFLHKQMIKYNFKKADRILSTSHVMAKETSKYTNKKIDVTPFGIDIDFFKAEKKTTLFSENDIVIGTIKTLQVKYGIEYLIKAFSIVKAKHPDLSLKLLIVGGGNLESELKNLAKELGIENCVVFTGAINYLDVPLYQNMLDVYVALSITESFGVAILEAQACEKPVVVSNVGGLPEVVDENVTGFIVPPKDENAAAEAIEKLVLDTNLRKAMGQAGRERVKRYYTWDDNVNLMIDIYKSILSKGNK